MDIHLEPQGHIFIFITMYCSFYVNFFKGVVSKEILSWWCVVIMACPFVVVVVVCLFVCLFVMMPLCALYLFLSTFLTSSISEVTHTEMTRPYRNDKVVTTLAQGCHNAFLQPCHNLGTTLYFETVARL